MEPMKPMKPMKPMEWMKPMEPMEPPEPWWPARLGLPDSSGSQNHARYAYFADSKRLVVDADGKVVTYDTGDHRISGFGQQSSAASMTFTSDHGTVNLDSLEVVDG